MVRSKFPGKPSKIVNRRVVKANKYCVLQDTECSKAAENISYGLAVFNETFGDHEQVSTAFHGFSPHEVDEAREIALEQHGKVDLEYQNSGLNFLPEAAFPVKIDLPSPQVLAYVEANLSVIGPVGWHTTRAQCQNLHSEERGFSKSSPLKLYSPLQDTIKKHVANRLLQKAKKNNLEVSKFVLPCRSARSSRVIKPNKRFLDNEESDKDDTLPCNTSGRSLPTRVIELKKPRLIFDGKDASPCVSSNGPCSVGATALSLDHNREQMKLTDLNVFGATTTRPKRNASQSCADGSPQKDGSLSSQASVQGPGVVSPSRSKLILRESKLNVCSSTEQLKEGLFSMKPKKGLGVKVVKSPGTSVECGVCGAIRFHRLTKQALKFGSTCCDPCHKFVAKMMVRARSSENSVPCENGQGNCAVSSPLKGESFATKVNRCGACWLLLCVQRLPKIPEKIRDDLIRMLPANMQGMTVVLPPVTIVSHVAGNKNKRRREHTSGSQDVVQKLSPKSSNGVSPSNKRKLSASSASKRLNQTPVARIKRKAALVSLANNLRRVRDKAFSTALTPTPSKKCPSTRDTLEKPHQVKKCSPSKTSESHSKTADKGVRMGALKNTGKSKDGQVRQKLSLKGPRVKHVCRSASIVLGQPLALFPTKSPVSAGDCDIPSNIKDESLVLLSASAAASDVVVPSSRDKCNLVEMAHKAGRKTMVTFDVTEKEILTAKTSLTTSLSTEPNLKLIPKTAPESRVSHVSAGRKVTKHPHTAIQSKTLKKGYRRTLQDLGVYNQTDTLPELISLDFWESYDPDEVCNSGFGLIGFDPFLTKPICFLCGSAGKQKLIHCASCCEPYHKFCVEMGILGGPAPLQQSIKDIDGWRVDWVCPRCTVCHGCGYNTGHQLTVCQRCHHSYHLECLGTSTLRKSAGDRLWVCSACLRCKSCNSTDVSKFVGNLPFCKVCFKLRQKGNFCPLCQGCYTDDDYQSKMMECAECKSWVHAKCEGLSDEKYQVLSYLPESVEFVCRLCCACPPAPWWLAVEAELQAGYINIIKAITKNRKAYAMLKWSPQKACDCQHKPIAPALRIFNPGIAHGKRKLSFNIKSQEQESASRAALGLYQGLEVNPSCNEDQMSSVFEFDDDIDAGENEPITRYIHAKGKTKTDTVPGKSGLLLDCGGDIAEKSDKCAQFSPNADSGVGSTDDELKTCIEEEYKQESRRITGGSQECICASQNSKHPFSTLLNIKKKVQSSKYLSIIQFHQDMDQLISEADSHEVKELYHQTLQDVFPWFDPKYDKISRNSFPMSPCKPHHGSLLQYQSQDTSPEKPNANLTSYVLEKLLPKDMKELHPDYFYYGTNFSDIRVCSFCKLIGDGDAATEGRLLYCGQNEWVHVNCALWSAEVFEEIDGALQNVSNALSRGRMIRCSQCGKKGASVGCCAKKCEETLHFPCARMAGFVFMEDKNAFCSLHARDAPGKPLTEPSDFDVARPVFVELDRRKKKSVEGKHARLMIGSLFVQSLGNIVPEMSDQELLLVPTEFCCTRLFWSSKEPWRIVQYTISTSIQFPTPEPVTDLGYHVTVDHSKESLGGVSKLNLDCSLQVPSFRETTCEGGESDKDSKDSLPCDSAKVAGAVMSHIIDTVCSKETDDEGTDVPNSADLLPPELKDAIFDELPHDLLAGISMQDIFQDRFLSYEELSKDEPEDPKIDSDQCKKLKNLKSSRELKRSKSDVLPGNSSQTDGQPHQRSCSLAWKLSATEVVMERTKLIQELRLSVKPASSVDLRYCLTGPGDKGKENQSVSWPRIMQVDGVADDVLSCSDEGSDVEVLDAIPISEQKSNPEAFIGVNFFRESELLCNRIECLKTVTSAALSQTSVLGNGSSTVNQALRKCKRRRLGKKVSTSDLMKELLIPQVDGTNDLSSDSDQEEACGSIFQEQCDDKPVRCNRCGCTYRTEESYARHLPSCSGDFSLTTSESEAEISEEENGSTSKSVSAPSPDSAISVSSGCLLTAPPVSPSALPLASTPTPLAPKSQSLVSASQRKDQAATVFTNNSINVVSIQKDHIAVKNNAIAAVSKVQKTSASKSKTTKTASHQQTLKLTVKGNKTALQHRQFYQHNSQQQISQQQISQHAIQHALSTSMAQQPQMITMLDYQQSQQSAPTVLVQSVPSQAMVPAYLEAFQQHTGQNLQYLTTVDSNGGFGKTQYYAAVPSPLLPGAFQLQTIADGQLCIEPSPVGIPALSGIQLAPTQLAPAPIAHTQPQVLGTLLQNPLSCGVMAAAEPIYETIQMFPDQSGGVLLASQPMLTCMETVVSNTFMSMSSSQFVSSSVPGMLQGSSTYSTTTTQVFQASKVDPPVMDVPTQYVVVNAHPSLTEATVGKLEVMSISQPRMQEQAPLQSQAQIQMSSINLPVSVSVSAPVSLQSLPPVATTSIAPILKMQPQRTYSKPSKAPKDCVVRKPVQPLTCSAVKETLKVLTSQPHQSKGEKATSFCVASNMGTSCVKVNVPGQLPEKTVALKCNFGSSTPSAVQVPSHLITTSTAPAQSITLPDPVQLNPSTNGPKIVSDSVPAAKCPPVTFSYRTHAIEKSKPKKTPALVGSTEASKNNVDAEIKPLEVGTGKHDATCFKTSHTAGQLVSSLSGSGSVVARQAASKTSCSPTSNSLTSDTTQSGEKLSQMQIVSTEISSCRSPSRAAVTDSNSLSNVPIVPVSCSLSSVQSVAPSPPLAGQLMVLGSGTVASPTVASPQSQVGKNVSLSLTTASLTNSLTNTTANPTAFTISSVPVATAKLQSSHVSELKPLKEINQASFNSDLKSGPTKIQDKVSATVPPTILKSASQNVDVPKKNDVFRSQGDVPIVLSSNDNSSSSLKLLFQKQAHNGCYTVSSSPGKKDSEVMAVKLADISIVTNGIRDRKVGKDESENVEPMERGSKKNQLSPSTPKIIYEIHCQDGFSYTSSSLSDAWQKVFGAVQEARANHKMPPLIHNPFNSIESSHNVMGLGNNSVKYLLEQLPGVGDCRKYRPIYHKSRLPGPGYQNKREDLDLLKESRSGCARTEPYLSAKRYDMFSWLDSRHRRPPKLLDNNDIDALTGSRRTASTSLPMAMRYRHLRETSKTSVGVFRSDIHGRGLFCLRDIEAGEMVIEYAGEVIRNTLTDNREKYYQSKGIGCYMFKVDDNFTVDATVKGNAARFINHSCEPNCYSRVVDILGKKHIIIFAFRRIPQGEELTYDYKFPIEDEKIHCHCLARRCRKYLN